MSYLPPSSVLDASALDKGIGSQFVADLLHKIFLKTNLVNGSAAMGIIDSFPVGGIAFISDNDLAVLRAVVIALCLVLCFVSFPFY